MVKMFHVPVNGKKRRESMRQRCVRGNDQNASTMMKDKKITVSNTLLIQKKIKGKYIQAHHSRTAEETKREKTSLKLPDPGAQHRFPFICVIFNFFHQCLMIF